MSKNLFGSLLEKEYAYRASDIVEDLKDVVPDRSPFFSTSPYNSWGSAAGFQFGTMELLYGPKSSGKTMLALDRIKMVQATDPEIIAVFVDAEMSFEYESTIHWLKSNGVDTDRLLIVREVCIKKIFEEYIMRDIQLAIKTEGVKVGIIVMDSIQAMSVLNIPTTEVQIKKAGTKDGSVTKQDYGARANYISRIMPFYRKFCRDNRVFTTFIGQARHGGTDRHGNLKWDTNGGEALFHEIQYKTLVTPAGQPIFSDTHKDANGNPMKIGHRIKFVFEKNKMAEGQDRIGFTDIIYMKGIVNTEKELVELCSKIGVIQQAGAWFSYGEHRAQGAEKMGELIKQNPEIYTELFIAMFRH